MTGGRRLVRQIKDMPEAVREEVVRQIKKTTEQAAKVARMLVPVKTGELKGWIRTTYPPEDMRGVVEVGPKGDRKAHAKARSVEFGRKKGNRGTTTAQPYVRRAQAFVAKGFRGRISAAIRKGVKRTTAGG